MALAHKAAVFRLLIKNNPAMFTAVRNHWSKDFKPGPFPRTEAEREAAAEKYGLLPSEYKVYDDDGQGKGDYPKFKPESAERRDPFYPWDSPELKRNFCETMQADEDFYGENRYDISGRYRKSVPIYFLEFFGWMSLMGALIFFFEDKKMFHALSAKQYPKPDLKHYTFELEN
ncbi:hypothetical protein FQA39_LY05301 [Lamprigera yunnana]|nr:hypothetical protein FQA39_LY05301 [Lamprigera yunnana]